MTRLPDDFLKTVVFLYPSHEDASQGRKTGGTGFLVSIMSEAVEGHYYYAITNRHVIEGGSTTVRVNRSDGSSEIIDSNETEWTLSETHDLAAIQFAPNGTPFDIKYIGQEHFLDEATHAGLNVGVGDEIFVAGRLAGADGTVINQPIYRFGRLAANGTRIVDGQESFLAEARSIEGLSGAPVFLGINGMYIRPGVLAPARSRSWLLGVQWGFVHDEAPVFYKGQDQATHIVKLNTGIMTVVPAWRLWSLLQSEPLVANRKAGDEIALKNGMPPRIGKE